MNELTKAERLFLLDYVTDIVAESLRTAVKDWALSSGAESDVLKKVVVATTPGWNFTVTLERVSK